VLPGLAGSTLALGLALLAVGACSGAADVAVNAEVSALEAETGTRLMQLGHALFSTGLIGGAIAAGLLRQGGVGRLAVLAVPAAALLAVAALNHGAPARPAPRDGAGGPRRRLPRGVVFLGLACAAAFVVEGGLETWSALFLSRELDAGAAASATGPASYATAMAAGRLVAHRVAPRVGDTRLLAGGGALCAAGCVGASMSDAVPLAAAALFAAGLGVSVAAPTLFGAAGRSSTERARAVAAVTTLGYLGFVVGPPVVGGLAELAGLRASFALLGVVALGVAIAAPRLPLGAEAAARPTV
jgi:fucose permease